MSLFNSRKSLEELPSKESALVGRSQPLAVADCHFVNGHPMQPPYPPEMAVIVFGLGCFWGAERLFWQLAEVFVTAVGYAGGHTPNPSYEEVCSGLTGHTEAVQVVFDPERLPLTRILKVFWESHDPTQGLRQGNDIGTQYRSAIYPGSQDQLALVEVSKRCYQHALDQGGRGPITTEIILSRQFYFAEDYHQQYLAKNPGGYCGLAGTGVTYR